MNVSALHAVAAEQRGLVAVWQGRLFGIPDTTLESHFGRRGWTRVAPGVWLAPGAPEPDRVAVRAAVLRVGPPAAVARWTAAAVHGLHQPRLLTQLVVPATRRATTLEHVETLRTRTWDDADVVWVDGIPVTTMARTICDLAATASLDALRRLVIDACQQRRLTLVALLEQLAKAGSIEGRRKVLRVLRELDQNAVDSEFERLVAAWLRSVGLEVVTQYRLDTKTGTVHLDIALPGFKLAIECEGFAFHDARRHRSVDSIRTKAIQAVHWLVVPITWDEFTTGKPQFLETLHDTMATR
ncbi:MAG: hypothetical protein ACI867_001198 [Glaciecola sp.]|jgi:hypothetical protein